MLYVGRTPTTAPMNARWFPSAQKLGLALGDGESAQGEADLQHTFGQMICLLVLVPSLQAPPPQRRVFVQTATNMLPPEAPATFRAWPALNDEVRHPEPISDPGPGPGPPTHH